MRKILAAGFRSTFRVSLVDTGPMVATINR